MLSSSLRLALYWTVQNLQNPSLYLKCIYKVPSSFLKTLLVISDLEREKRSIFVQCFQICKSEKKWCTQSQMNVKKGL